MSKTTYTVEPLKTAASVLDDPQASIQLWAEGFANETLHLNAAFVAYLELDNYGPKNDWNSKRSTALRLSHQIETEVLTPARYLFWANKQAKA